MGVERSIAINVMLSLECLEGLEELAAAIRRGTGTLFTRSKLIRAIVAGVVAGRIDFSRCRTEEELAGMLVFVIDAFSKRALDGPSAGTNGLAAPRAGSMPPSAPSPMSRPAAPASALRKSGAMPTIGFGRSLSGTRR